MVRQLREGESEDRQPCLRQHSVAARPLVRGFAGYAHVEDNRPQRLANGVHSLLVPLPGIDLTISVEHAGAALHPRLETAADLGRHPGRLEIAAQALGCLHSMMLRQPFSRSSSFLEPGIELDKIVPKRVEYRPRYFRKGTLSRLIRDYLREHRGEIMVADILGLNSMSISPMRESWLPSPAFGSETSFLPISPLDRMSP